MGFPGLVTWVQETHGSRESFPNSINPVLLGIILLRFHERFAEIRGQVRRSPLSPLLWDFPAVSQGDFSEQVAIISSPGLEEHVM